MTKLGHPATEIAFRRVFIFVHWIPPEKMLNIIKYQII
jgi:hypothetical protein